ncbi:HD domain-containing protein [Peribacillus saganii]|uniref:HD domain-containing protein n=1 Tax=Peribacillus saganii TaxID=2303992 RepID=A0A372LLY7_9BACI|nr:HD domain-containing phosphohydrolase [Peribacillus saganii]RFU68102.1 HD domain-containing protein [Peribacillus saganii]
MRLISLDEYRHQTMQLARPVFDKQNRVLLAEGRRIHPVFLKRLLELDIRYIFIEDAVSKGITMEEMVDMPTWMDAIAVIKKCFEAVREKKPIPVKEMQKIVKQLTDEVYKRSAIVLAPTTFLSEELRLYAHAVNVSLLSIFLGKKKGFTNLQVKDLAMGAALHDIGKAESGDITDHPTRGFEILKRINEMSLLAAHCAFQHHEAFDGSGVPRKLAGKNIHEYGQICSIANDYENLVSIEGFTPHYALEMIMTRSGIKYREDLVSLFVQQIPFYPPGTRLMLNKGQEAIVVKITNNIQRPYIRLLATEEELSLAEHPTMLVTKVIVDKVPQMEELELERG